MRDLIVALLEPQHTTVLHEKGALLTSTAQRNETEFAISLAKTLINLSMCITRTSACITLGSSCAHPGKQVLFALQHVWMHRHIASACILLCGYPQGVSQSSTTFAEHCRRAYGRCTRAHLASQHACSHSCRPPVTAAPGSPPASWPAATPSHTQNETRQRGPCHESCSSPQPRSPSSARRHCRLQKWGGLSSVHISVVRSSSHTSFNWQTCSRSWRIF